MYPTVSLQVPKFGACCTSMCILASCPMHRFCPRKIDYRRPPDPYLLIRETIMYDIMWVSQKFVWHWEFLALLVPDFLALSKQKILIRPKKGDLPWRPPLKSYRMIKRWNCPYWSEVGGNLLHIFNYVTCNYVTQMIARVLWVVKICYSVINNKAKLPYRLPSYSPLPSGFISLLMKLWYVT